MNVTAKVLLVVGAAWIALSPPLFTGGACSAEFDQETRRLDQDPKALRTPAAARAYFSERSVPFSVITTEQCRKAKPRYLSRCGDGPLLVARVPVSNTICRIYRDDEIAVRLQYDDRDRLQRMVVDMSPFKSLPLPFGWGAIHWAR